MKTSARSPETARFVARLLASRPTSISDIPSLFDAVAAGLSPNFGERQRTAKVESAALAPTAEPLEPYVPLKRKRGRPRKERNPFADASDPAAADVAVAASTSRLMRRSDIVPRAADEAETLAALAVMPQSGLARTVVRGIVKWWDPKVRRGMLRLPGHGDDVTVEGEALDRAGIPRLFKGQEIEASVVIDEGRARLMTLSLPGRPQTETLLPHSTGRGSARRHAKPVVIEMKRDALRRVAARVEAEHILGGGVGGAGGRHG